MAPHRQKRGAVGQAAQALKDALSSRLQPGAKDVPINDGLYSAMQLVDAFLWAHKESEAELDQLKAQVKRVVVDRLRAAAAVDTASKAERPSTSPKNDAEVESLCPRVQLYSRAGSRAGSMTSRSGSVDWTLPQRLLNRKAFVKGGDFATLTIKQDELASKAERQRLLDGAELKRTTMRMFDEQMAQVAARRSEAREQRRREQDDMDGEVAQYKLDEVARERRAREAQQATRTMFASQVQELAERRRREAVAAERERALARQQLAEEAAAERERLEQLARSNAALRGGIKSALQEAVQAKAAAKAQQMAEEQRYSVQYMAKMDADEAARQAAVAAREERLRRAFERGGGVALQRGLEEQARLDAERAERMQAEFNAQQAELERRKSEQRRQVLADTQRTLAGQIAAKQAERAAAREEALRIRQQWTEQQAADKAQEQADKEAMRRAQAEALERQKAQVAEEHKRRYQEYREPFDPKYRWLHDQAQAGTLRAFNNLAVPQGKEAWLLSV